MLEKAPMVTKVDIDRGKQGDPTWLLLDCVDEQKWKVTSRVMQTAGGAEVVVDLDRSNSERGINKSLGRVSWP